MSLCQKHLMNGHQFCSWFSLYYWSQDVFFELAPKSVLWMLLLLGKVKHKAHRSQNCKRQPRRLLNDSLTRWGQKAYPAPRFKKRNWFKFQSKENSVLTLKNGKFCRGRLVEISFYENDSYGCCSYIYEILCLNSWWYYLWEVVSYQISFFWLFRVFSFGLIIKVVKW